MVTDGLSWVIFNNTNWCLDWLVHKLVKDIKLYYDNNKWFWKSHKRSYKYILMQLTKKDRAIQIQKKGEEAISVFLVGWISFYWESILQFKFLFLDVFFAVGIIVFKIS